MPMYIKNVVIRGNGKTAWLRCCVPGKTTLHNAMKKEGMYRCCACTREQLSTR